MDHLVITVLVCLAQCAPTTVRIWDGDTAWFGDQKIRMVGYDTPERGARAKCAHEAEMAEKALVRLGELFTSARRIDVVMVKGHSYDRSLATVSVDGRPVGDLLIQEGLATKRMAKRERWC